MLFQTYAFFLFFLVAFSAFWLAPLQKPRLAWLLVASVVFYGFWNPWFLILIGLSTSVDYLVGLRLPGVGNPRRRRAWLVLSVGLNVGILVAFKYSRFFLDTLDSAAALAGVTLPPPTFSLVLPLGISFYTFEAISYVVDVYRGRIEPVRNPLHYALYILFFPHLIAGPIVRGHEFLPQLRRRTRLDWARLDTALRLFLLGLFKKVVMADRLAPIVDPVFAAPAQYSTGTLWLATFGYSVQVYCDFSGYSDMAIGLAHAFGIKLPDNFNLPYFAPNIAEFWRRWHMTLSRWLRDYVYIPLGGSRGGSLATTRNLIVTMSIAGLWHGAAWHIVLWGVYHGVLLSAHRVFARGRPPASGAKLPISMAATYLSICLGLVVFRTASLAEAGTMLARMMTPAAGVSLDAGPRTVLAAILGLTFVGHAVGSAIDVPRVAWRVPALVRGAALAALLIAIQLLVPANGAAFIYFQF